MPGQNYHNAQTVLYLCPFFQSETGLCIRCEGLVGDTVNGTHFLNKRALEAFRKRYCFTFEYGACHWAKALCAAKYENARKETEKSAHPQR